MNCPKCNAPNAVGSRFCENCGASLVQAEAAARNRRVLQTATASGTALGQAARQSRLYADYSNATIISARRYNLIMGAVVLWGLLVNFIVCLFADASFIEASPLLFLLVYVMLCFVGVRMAMRSTNPWVSFLGYNIIVLPMGFVVAYSVQYYMGVDPAIVSLALMNTLLITAGMVFAALALPGLFDKIGGMLLGILIGLIVGELVMTLLGMPMVIIEVLFAALFAFYIGYDIHRAQQLPKTVDNAVDCALDLYLDIINLFLRLLEILSRRED